MKIIFYQNILSMHQSAFLRELAQLPGNQVTLVVEAVEEYGRAKQGWIKPDFGKCEVIVGPSEQQLELLTKELEAIHVFTGLCAFPMVTQAFKKSCRIKEARRFIYSEPWRNEKNIKGFLRALRSKWLVWRYSRYIELFLLTGQLGIESFVKQGVLRNKCLCWGYFTEMPVITNNLPLTKEHSVLRFIFIGTWDVRKNIKSLISSLKNIAFPCECLLLGDGVLHDEVVQSTKSDKRFRVVGSVPNHDIGNWLSVCDVLVLPSLFDGWGAVVNEALLCGTRALVSEQCGAASLIETECHGAVFKLEKLQEALVTQIHQGVQNENERYRLKQWAIKTLSGKKAAENFMKICREKGENE